MYRTVEADTGKRSEGNNVRMGRPARHLNKEQVAPTHDVSSSSTLLHPFNSGTFVGEALNKADFSMSKGSKCAIVDTPLSTRYAQPSRVAVYVNHEPAYKIILTATIFPQSIDLSGTLWRVSSLNV